MTSHPVSALATPAMRRNAVWPWLVMPMIILAVFYVLHSVRQGGAPGDPETSFGSLIP